MLYPDKLMLIEEGFSLYLPDPELVKPVYENLLAKDPATAFPFWAKIWPSAWVMITFLRAEPGWIEGKRILEIGAGIGLPSLIMAHHAKEMIISDHSPEAVALLEKNIRFLGLHHVKAMNIDWNSFPEKLAADIVLLSDINYAPDQFASVIALIRKLLEQDAVIILTTPQRITIKPFAEAVQPFIRYSALETVMDMNKPVDIRVLILAQNELPAG